MPLALAVDQGRQITRRGDVKHDKPILGTLGIGYYFHSDLTRKHAFRELADAMQMVLQT
jgi:hypothetical protein